MSKNIYLTGFMGSGKTTIAQTLAKTLHRPFVDTDAVIAAINQASITEIFESQGEAAFRYKEECVLAEQATKQGLIVSLGGGVVLSEQNRALLKNGIWIFLDVPAHILKKRLMDNNDRPLLKISTDWEELLKMRMPFYLEAPHQISCGDLDPDAVCQKILTALKGTA